MDRDARLAHNLFVRFRKSLKSTLASIIPIHYEAHLVIITN